MLPNSVRRAVAVPPTPLVASLAAAAPRAAAASRPFGHQRRYSSSKPSSSDNGPKDIPGQSPAVPASASSPKSSGRKRKAKDADRAASTLPSVPSTQHLSQEVTHSMPKSITEEAFATIFNLRNKPASASEVISTLSRAADDMDGAMAKMTIAQQPEADANGDPVRKVDFHHADGSESSVYLQLNAMAGQFVPFRPPPAPEAQSADVANARVEAAADAFLEDSAQQNTRVYKALFTIEESTDASGEVRVVAHSPRIIDNADAAEGPAPRSFLERMARRQVLFNEAQVAGGASADANGMHAISVRRQRKLKMKKQKYKKLQKKTRNLRRKLDRL